MDLKLKQMLLMILLEATSLYCQAANDKFTRPAINKVITTCSLRRMQKLFPTDVITCIG